MPRAGDDVERRRSIASPGADVTNWMILLARTDEGALARAEMLRPPRRAVAACASWSVGAACVRATSPTEPRGASSPSRRHGGTPSRARRPGAVAFVDDVVIAGDGSLAPPCWWRSREPGSLRTAVAADRALPSEDASRTLSNKRMEQTIASVGGCASSLLRLQLIRETLDRPNILQPLTRARSPTTPRASLDAAVEYESWVAMV